VKDTLKRRFEMVDLGPCSYYLSILVKQDQQNQAIYLSQQGYIEKILRNLRIEDAKPVPTLITPNKLELIDDDYKPSQELKN
jgi:hypothetical protein